MAAYDPESRDETPEYPKNKKIKNKSLAVRGHNVFILLVVEGLFNSRILS